MKKPLVVANWKMYVEKPEAAKVFATALKRKARSFVKVDIVLAPAFTLIPAVVATVKGSALKVAGQTVSAHEDGQHTGDVSAPMLKAAGASWVIVGHSERRTLLVGAGETNDMVRAQVMRAQAAGLMVILCVGETQRDPSGAHFSVIAQQLTSALTDSATRPGSNKIVIAYEPVWAVGNSAAEAMHPADLREMVIFIRKTLADIMGRQSGVRVPILYGGSVDATNAADLLEGGDIAGFLVGRASTNLGSFVELLQVCQTPRKLANRAQ